MTTATPWHRTMDAAETELRAAELAPDLDAAVAAATDAVTRFRAALDLAPVAQGPLDWAETQTRLSVALRLLGALLDDVGLLHDAIRSAQAALSVAPLATAPQVWGRAHAALGSVHVVLGERDADLASLAEAATCYAEALAGFPRAAVPRDWARMMRNRGAALSLLGEVANDPDALIDAIGCYRAALEVYAPTATPADPAPPAPAPAADGPTDRVPPGVLSEASPQAVPGAVPAGAAPGILADWALTQSNLGQALRLLGERDDTQEGTGLLRDAVAACAAALAGTARERTAQDRAPQDRAMQDRAPHAWAMTATNLANALAALAVRDGDTACLRQAIACYRQALAALDGPRWLRQRAIARHNLALAERRLAAWDFAGA